MLIFFTGLLVQIIELIIGFLIIFFINLRDMRIKEFCSLGHREHDK